MPLLLAKILGGNGGQALLQVSLWAFFVMSSGAVGCIVGGFISQKTGSAWVAWSVLATSGLICLLFPLAQDWPLSCKLALMLIWGTAAAADSPQFSAMSGSACPPALVGSALALQNSLGFMFTAFTILLTTSVYPEVGDKVTWILVPGPLLGLWYMRRLLQPALVKSIA